MNPFYFDMLNVYTEMI